MSKKEFIVGLDIGTTKVVCIVGEIGPSTAAHFSGNSSASSAINIVGFGQAPSTGLRKVS